MEMPSSFEETEVIWGAAAIGSIIGQTRRQTFELLKTGRLKGARKIGGRWCITRRALLENFEPTPLSYRLRDLAKHLTPEECQAFFGGTAL